MMQTIEQTDEEKLKMYMKLSNKELALMLIEANKSIEAIRPAIRELDKRTSHLQVVGLHDHYNDTLAYSKNWNKESSIPVKFM